MSGESQGSRFVSKMNKTPVAALQETAAKAGCIPRYEIISQQAGTHENMFVTRVLCNNVSADGKGSNKKTSKHNAAEAMLELIKNDSNLSLMKAHLNNLMQEYSVTAPIVRSLQNSPERDTITDSQNNEFINYVGKLQETCIIHNFGVPKYQDVHKQGPDHASTHTVSCTLSSLYADASGFTKKQAKQAVAKKILETLISRENISELIMSPSPIRKLSTTSIQDIGTRILELNIKSDDDIQESSQKAIVLFKSIKEKANIPENEVPATSFLKNSQGVAIEYESVLELEKSINSLNGSSSKIDYLIDQLEKRFSLKTKMITFPVKQPKFYLKGIRLNTEPLIVGIGRGETREQTESEVVFQILGTMLQWSS